MYWQKMEPRNARRNWAIIPAVIGLASTLISTFANKGGAAAGGGGGAPKPQATSTITGGAIAPGVSATDFTKDQTAWWQQMLQGTGQGGPGGALPQDISGMIEKQASLIGPGQ